MVTKKAKKPTKSAKKPRVAYNTWQPVFLVRIYRLARLGVPDVDICSQLSISRESYYRWQREKPELVEAMQMAATELDKGESFPQWIYQRLSPDLQALWDEIGRIDSGKHTKKNAVVLIESLLQDKGRKTRQQLFLHALCYCSFSPSHAMNKVGLSKPMLDLWLAEDAEFATLVQEIEWHKGNFFEGKLVDLVQQGYPAAVLFANRTFNKSRGYASSAEINVKHSGQVLHGVLDMTELAKYMTPEVQQGVMAALVRRDEEVGRQQLLKNDPAAMLGEEIAQRAMATVESL